MEQDPQSRPWATLQTDLLASVRTFIAVLAPAVALAVWAGISHPAAAGFLGILVATATLVAALIGFILARGNVAGRSALGAWLVFIAGAAVTAFYWYRVWSYRQYEMEGIPLVLFYAFGFWWPGLFVATASRFLEGGFATLTRRRYMLRLAVGLLAGVVGAAGYEAGDTLYYEDRDRVPFEEATAYLAPAGPWVERGSFDLSHEAGRVAARFVVDPARAESIYELLRQIENTLTLVRQLLGRKDTSRVEVQVEAPGGELLRFAADEGDAARSTWSLVQVEPARLPEEGRLTRRDLEAIVSWSHPELTDPEREVFARDFRYGVEDRTVTIAFEPSAPFSPVNAHLHGAAWRAANAIVAETVRFFPGVDEFAIDFPGVDARVVRGRAAEVGFRLQALRAPADRVLGLVVRNEGKGEGSLEPARFYPGGLPVAEAQIAIVRVMDPLVEHSAGALFEEVLIGTGRLYVVALDAGGAAEVVFVPWESRGFGPVRVAPGDEVKLGLEAIRNLGWFPRDAFARPEAPTGAVVAPLGGVPSGGGR